MAGVAWKSLDEVEAHERAKFPGDDAHAAREIGQSSFLKRFFRRLFTHRASNWRGAESLKMLWGQVDRLAPGRNRENDGMIGDADHQSRDSDHNPWVRDGDIGVVTALDVTDDPSHGCHVQAIVDAICNSRDRRVKYIIWNRRIVNSSRIGGSPPWTWRGYDGDDPHIHHMHVSVLPDKPLYDDRTEWTIRGLGSEPERPTRLVATDTNLYDRPNGTPGPEVFAGERVGVLAGEDHGWIKVATSGATGFVMTEMLAPEGMS